MLRRSLGLIALIGLASCAPAAPPPVVAPKVAAPQPAPKPVAARWVFPDDAEPVAQVKTGKGETLLVGEHGRRWVVGADKKVSSAESLARAALVDVRVDDGRFAFLGSDGSYQTSDAPLGPLARKVDGPTASILESCFGDRSLLAITAEGVLHRAADPLTPWSAKPLGLMPGERVVSIASDRKGKVLVLVHPQRLLLSSDDGATFAPLALVGIGAEALVRDADDALFLRGAFGLTAKLVGSKLVTGQSPAPLAGATDEDATVEPPATVVAGDRFVRVHGFYTEGKRPIRVSIGAMGEKLPEPQTVSESDGPVHIGGFGSEIALAVEDYEADALVVFSTSDDGKTFGKVATFPGSTNGLARVIVGPKGWMLVSGTCVEDACSGPRVRIGGAWKELPKELRVGAHAIDEKGEWLYFHDEESDAIMKLGLADTTPSKVSVIDLQGDLVHAISVDDAGTLRVLHGHPWRLTRVAATGAASGPPLWVPFDGSTVALAGARGLATSEDGAGFETMDGGEHWTSVALPAEADLACSRVGCVAGQALRVGWDLPAISGATLASTEVARPSKPTQPETPKAKPSVTLDCVHDDKWTRFAGASESNSPELHAGIGDLRWLASTGVGLLVIGRQGKEPKTVTLLDTPKSESSGKSTRTHRFSSTWGVAAARFSYGPKVGGAYSPVDVTIGFYDFATAKTVKAEIPQVKPFRVGSLAPGALLQVVEGGALFVPENGAAPMYFVRLDGKVETLPRPPSGPAAGRYRAAAKVGSNEIVLIGGADGVEIAHTKDRGKTWTTTVWSLGASPSLSIAFGKVFVRPDRSRGVAFAIDPLGPELPSPTTFGTPPAPQLAACDPKTLLGHPVLDVSPGILLKIRAKKGSSVTELSTTSRLTFFTDGKACTGGAHAEGQELEAIVSPHDLAHGQLFRRDKDDWVGTPLVCKAP